MVFIPEETEEGKAILAEFEQRKHDLIAEHDALQDKWSKAVTEKSRAYYAGLYAEWDKRKEAAQQELIARLEAIPNPEEPSEQ